MISNRMNRLVYNGQRWPIVYGSSVIHVSLLVLLLLPAKIVNHVKKEIL
jgi:hypothetical protein